MTRESQHIIYTHVCGGHLLLYYLLCLVSVMIQQGFVHHQPVSGYAVIDYGSLCGEACLWWDSL